MDWKQVFVWVRQILWILAVAAGLTYIALDYFEDEEIKQFAGQVSENLQDFIILANRGPAYDEDCQEHEGRPDSMEEKTLKRTESMKIEVGGKSYNVLVDPEAVYVGYSWPNPEPIYTLMFCKFPL